MNSRRESGGIQGLRAVEWIRRNAIRLFEDAELLHRNHRYPSAMNLSFLAIEESLKFCIKYYEITSEKNLGQISMHHVEKFKYVPIFRIAEITMQLAEIGERQMPIWKEKIASGEFVVDDQELALAEHAIKELQKAVPKETLLKWYFEFFGKFYANLRSAVDKDFEQAPYELNEVRKMTVYADVDDQMALTNVPMFFGRDISAQYVEIATRCVDFIKEIDLGSAEETA